MMDALLKQLLFLLPPEGAHEASLLLLSNAEEVELGSMLDRFYRPRRQRPVELMGLTFPNPVGLAAGYDKDGRVWRTLSRLGFGHVEVGTVTPQPQPGNPKPRVFRLEADRALINRLGFPSQGADAVRARLVGMKPHPMILGVNLGKNKATPNEEAGQDYVRLVGVFAEVADYLVVNVSSPNTPGLRELQRGEPLRALLRQVVAARDGERERIARRVPVLVKLAPDLGDADLDDALGAVADAGIDGVIATNTTISRDGVHGPFVQETGGLSGAPLTGRATAMIRAIRQRSGDDLPLIAVGGIMGTDDARARLDAGANLVQIYTGLVYGGPGMVRRVVEAL